MALTQREPTSVGPVVVQEVGMVTVLVIAVLVVLLLCGLKYLLR